IGYSAWKKSRITPDERERQRRAVLGGYGKMGAATLVEVRENHLFYSYQAPGVKDNAPADRLKLGEVISADLGGSGRGGVRSEARTPANSIVVAERWSGLRASKVS